MRNCPENISGGVPKRGEMPPKLRGAPNIWVVSRRWGVEAP